MSAFTRPAPIPCRIDADGMALLRTPVNDLRGIRYHSGDPANPPSTAVPPTTTPPATDPATTPPSTTPPTTTPPSTTPPATTPPANVDPITAPVGDVPFDQLPAATQAEVRRLRQADQAARAARTEWEQAGITPERRKELGKLLGYEQDETPDVAALTARVGEVTTRAETAESRASAAERANIVLLEAPDAGGNPRLLLDSMGFRQTIEGLDPSDSAGIKTAIETWLTAHPEHRAAAVPPVPGSVGVTRPAGASGAAPKPGLEGAIAAAQGVQTPSR